jgi:hypothetical protein
MKDMNAREIRADMNDTFGADCVGYSTVINYLRERSFSKLMLNTNIKRKIKKENFINKAIIGALEECSFSSLRQIPRRIFVLMSTVGYHLVNSLGYRIRNIRWVPHSLSSSQKQTRVETS